MSDKIYRMYGINTAVELLRPDAKWEWTGGVGLFGNSVAPSGDGGLGGGGGSGQGNSNSGSGAGGSGIVIIKAS